MTYTVFFPIIAIVAAIAWSATTIKNPVKTAFLTGFIATGWKVALMMNLGFPNKGSQLDSLMIVSVLGFYALAFYGEWRRCKKKKIT